MKKKGKIVSATAAFLIAVSAAGTGKLSALSGEDVLNDSVDEYQQNIIDYVFVKNYISGNIDLSDEFKKKLDINNDGVVNIMDSARLKQRILDGSQKNPQVTETAVTTNKPEVTVSVTEQTPAVTTVPQTQVTEVTTSVSSGDVKVGDYVSYSGEVHFTASGNGKTVNVSGIFKVVQIISETSSQPYGVQLENTGWVSYSKLTGGKKPVVTAPSEDIFAGKILRMKNVSSGKCLASTGTENNSNIIQTEKCDSESQLFRAMPYYNSGSYRLYICSSDKPMVVDIVKDGEKIAEGCNVQLYDAVDPEAQIWKIQSAGNGKYKILSAKNPDVALTVVGTSEGSAEGKKSDSAGNVYLSKYTGKDSQLWEIEIS